MTRKRPPTLLTLAHRVVRDHALFERGERVLCACSGGPDSNALLHVLALLRRRIGHEVIAAGVDHGLRAGARGELDLAASIAGELGIDMLRLEVDVNPGSNLQARARQARHAALQLAAAEHGAGTIALGHTADDRAETVIMRLLRGSGPAGLAVMPPQSPAIESTPEGDGSRLVRPLITSRRSDVLTHLKRHRVGFASDPSNRDKRFMRVRVRGEVMPLLEELSPSIVGHLCHLADKIRSNQMDRPSYPKGLNRAQLDALERAIRLKKGGTTVRVSGGRDLQVAFFGDTPVVFNVE